jgi:hypothetical protein
MDVQRFLDHQDGLITRSQALTLMTVGTLRHLLARRWTLVLPGVYAGFTGTLTERQQVRAALLYAGDDARLADVTALRRYQVRYLPEDPTVRLLIPATAHRANHGFVVVRRTHRLPRPRQIDGFPYCPPERALLEAGARLGDERTARAMISDAIQRQIADLVRLNAELRHITGRGSGVVRRAVRGVTEGARSAPELEFSELCRRDPRLPVPLLNPLLELPGGELISPDALFEEAGLVHETNGRAFHAEEDQFEDMQARHDIMTAAGLTVLHNSPRRIREEPTRVMDEVATCFRRLAGSGLPPGVRVVRRGPTG